PRLLPYPAGGPDSDDAELVPSLRLRARADPAAHGGRDRGRGPQARGGGGALLPHPVPLVANHRGVSILHGASAELPVSTFYAQHSVVLPSTAASYLQRRSPHIR